MRERRLAMHPDMSEAEKQAHWQMIDVVVRDLGTEELLELTRKEFHAFLCSYRIYSMSKRWDNLSVWQWYGDNHRGYCVEFKNKKFYQALREVVYVDEPITFDWTVVGDRDLEAFFCKHRRVIQTLECVH
jgi:hypothetical protein